MYRFLLATFLFIFLTGCSGLQTKQEYDKSAEDAVSVKFEGKTFVIQDDLNKSSAFVSEDAATDFFKSYVEGAFLTLIDLTAPVSQFEGAMLIYLEENKEGQCDIKRSNFISDNLGGGLGYEIYYECE
jgi:hypothetical protein